MKKCPVDMRDIDGYCLMENDIKCEDMKCTYDPDENNKYLRNKNPVGDIEFRDFGQITFGRFKGKRWQECPSKYLEYLISDECLTSYFNKEKAKVVLRYKDSMKGCLPGQLEDSRLKV